MSDAVVRLATARDAPGVIACLRLMHEENGLFALSEPRIADIIACALHPPPDLLIPPIIGVIGAPDDIAATICLKLTQLYYSEEWHLCDLWNYVRPDARGKMYITDLLTFAKSCADKTGFRLMAGVVSNKRTEAKVRIYARHFGPPLGAFFIYQPEKGAA